MNAQEFVIEATFKAADDFMRAVRRIPEDKLIWKPLDNGRSALSMAQECAHCPLWTVSTIYDLLGIKAELPGYEMTEQWTTLDACEEALRKHLELFRATVSAFPDDRLGESVSLQWGEFTLSQVLGFALWNLTYHYGQINYIQTLYGDFEHV